MPRLKRMDNSNKKVKCMSGRNLSLIGILATVFLLCFSAYGQSGASGAIGGAVLDSNGVPIANAQVEIEVAGTSTIVRTVFADASGNFTVASLPVNAYDVVVTATGFSTSKYNNVMVRLTETTRLNPSLSKAASMASGESAGSGQQMEKAMVEGPRPFTPGKTRIPPPGRPSDPM